MTMLIHCVYNVHTCQTVKGQVSRFPDADLIGKHLSLPWQYNGSPDAPWREKYVQEHRRHTCLLIDTGTLVNNITQLNIIRKTNWSECFIIYYSEKHPRVIFQMPVIPSAPTFIDLVVNNSNHHLPSAQSWLKLVRKWIQFFPLVITHAVCFII